ncbi:MAG TPA: PQQ-binding-like beta-propeller repeat protein, partial [Verrucomicrobium sp.]|nr:PQQ-binding-like beta-propeller repeat protein [Verrucomicrobium sp.]
MIRSIFLCITRLAPAFMLAVPLAAGAEWNQWRGADRNGICTDSAPLLETLPEGGLPVLWQSETIPSDHDGGHGSPVVAGGRVYLGLVWHVSVPSANRVIEEEHLVSLGYRDTRLLGDKLTRELEQTRKGLPAGLRGEALNERNRQWVKEHFNDEQRLILGSWAEWRLGQKSAAVDLEVLNCIHPRVDKPFASHEEMVQWFNEIKVGPGVQEKLIKIIPATVKEAQDVVLCLDLATGRTLWKVASPGKATGRMASSTCAVVDGTVYALGSTHMHALDAATGKVRWRQALGTSPTGSSPLVAGGRVIIMAGEVLCLSAADGSVLWRNAKVKGGHSSPVLWQPPGGAAVLVCPTDGDVAGLDPGTGKEAWKLPGGGPSTPVVSGNRLVLLSDAKDTGLQCFEAAVESGPPRRVWQHWWLAARYSASPLVWQDHVYLMEGGRHFCVAL